ncbi:Sel1-like repeat family protein [Skeletonema marinoi]|uniref:Sel1-like repeat family protein n=1 Tax=Skeletonema marinoi TaxID=267567 RepID=A0AAD8XX11_9STRA|nr:Sel1-like repeat family protein [Skeletonema marinoi]
MSTDKIVVDAADICCASCGIAEVDDIKMMENDACDLVKYCSDKCQQDHRPQHETMCKERVAELRDEILFRQPETSHMGECPICFLPLPLDHQKSVMQSCCGKVICHGCGYANLLREREEHVDHTCPFCRHPNPKNMEESNKNKMKRVEKNDPVAIREIGKKHYQKGEYQIAFEYLTKAADLGDASAHHHLSIMYQKGEGVEKDEKKELFHLVEAAIAGHPNARYNLAVNEERNGRCDRSIKHFIIAANLGHDGSIQALKGCYKHGDVSKEDFAGALRAHYAAVNATKSPQRGAAEKYLAQNAHRIVYNYLFRDHSLASTAQPIAPQLSKLYLLQAGPPPGR